MLVYDKPVTDDNPVPVAVMGGGGEGEGDTVVFEAPVDGLVYGRKDAGWSAVTGNFAPLVGGLVPAQYLPSYVDDVLEFANLAAFPATGESGKIYVALNNSWTYRWSGSIYIKIGQPISNSDDVPEGATNLYFTAARSALYLTIANAASTYQTIAGMSGYVTTGALSTALGNYYTKSESDAKYQTIAGMSSYVTNASLATTLGSYLTTANAASTYLTIANAASTYQTIAGMSNYSTTTQMNTAISNALSGYLTSATAASTYQTIAGMSSYVTNASLATTLGSYLTTATAASTYLTIANAASTYLTQANASSTYLTQANASSTYLTIANAASTYQTISGMSNYVTNTALATNYYNKTEVYTKAEVDALVGGGGGSPELGSVVKFDVTINDDSVYMIDLLGSGRLGLLAMTVFDNSNPGTVFSTMFLGVIALNGSSVSAVGGGSTGSFSIASGGSGTYLATPPTGTTGTDGVFNYTIAGSTKNMYLENRRGLALRVVGQYTPL